MKATMAAGVFAERMGGLGRVAALLIAACLFGTVHAAQGPPSEASDASGGFTPAHPAIFTPNEEFEVLLDGKPLADAMCYRSQGIPGMLIVASPIGRPVFARMSDRKVIGLDPSRVHASGDDLAVDPDAWGEPLADWQTSAGAAQFEFGGKKFQIEERSFIVGQRTIEQVLAGHPSYRRAMAQRKPDPGAIAVLKRDSEPVELKVFFASWCGVCEREMPGLLRALTDAANPKIHVILQGLPRAYKNEEAVLRDGVRHIPTVIVIRGGREIGRIEGPPHASYERDLATLLQSSSRVSGS